VGSSVIRIRVQNGMFTSIIVFGCAFEVSQLLHLETVVLDAPSDGVVGSLSLAVRLMLIRFLGYIIFAVH